MQNTRFPRGDRLRPTHIKPSLLSLTALRCAKDLFCKRNLTYSLLQLSRTGDPAFISWVNVVLVLTPKEKNSNKKVSTDSHSNQVDLSKFFWLVTPCICLGCYSIIKHSKRSGQWQCISLAVNWTHSWILASAQQSLGKQVKYSPQVNMDIK